MNHNIEMLREHPLFHDAMKSVKEHMPIIPVYNHDPDNTEEWKAKSNILKGFQLVLTLLGEET